MKKQNVPYGSDASSGTYRCVDCGEEIQVQSNQSLPPCPNFDDSHTQKAWEIVSGVGDAKEDPYPHRAKSS